MFTPELPWQEMLPGIISDICVFIFKSPNPCHYQQYGITKIAF
jgi:hypothetical protein